jgi:hypothetical protein
VPRHHHHNCVAVSDIPAPRHTHPGPVQIRKLPIAVLRLAPLLDRRVGANTGKWKHDGA